MKLTIIDDMNLNPDQIQQLKKHAMLRVFNDRPKTENEVIKRTSDSEAIISSFTKITDDIIAKCKNLKFILAAATGPKMIIDLQAAKKHKILVSSTPGYATEAVAELTFSLILALTRKLVLANKNVHRGSNKFLPFLGNELSGKTLGIIGLGKIGSRVAELGLAFGMKVIANDIKPKRKEGVKMVNLPTLLKKSNIISVHCDLNPTSKNLLKTKQFKLMKKKPIIINTAREEIINEKALFNALKKGTIEGLGLELNILKPNIKRSCPFLKFKNCILTPHIGFFTKEALEKRKEKCLENTLAFLKGKPKDLWT